MVDDVLLFTVERPWLQNQPYISCIPEGKYLCYSRPYYRGGYDAIALADVPMRSHILFHKANRPVDLAGCIAPVSYLACLDGDWAGLNSAAAFRRLMDWFGGEEFELEIQMWYPDHVRSQRDFE